MQKKHPVYKKHKSDLPEWIALIGIFVGTIALLIMAVSTIINGFQWPFH